VPVHGPDARPKLEVEAPQARLLNVLRVVCGQPDPLCYANLTLLKQKNVLVPHRIRHPNDSPFKPPE
jgi:hypothetical protein